MAKEDNKGIAERSGEVVRNSGLIVALVGTVLWLARQPIGGDIFVAGAIGAGAGEVGRRIAKKRQ